MRVDCFDWLRDTFGVTNLVKGLEFVEPQYHDLEPERILARHHQIAVGFDLHLAPECKCPSEFDQKIYLHERALERIDHFSRP